MGHLAAQQAIFLYKILGDKFPEIAKAEVFISIIDVPLI